MTLRSQKKKTVFSPLKPFQSSAVLFACLSVCTENGKTLILLQSKWQQITGWYQAKYPSAESWVGSLGNFPIDLGTDICAGFCPLDIDPVVDTLRQFFDKETSRRLRTLPTPKQSEVRGRSRQAFQSFRELYHLELIDHVLSDTQKNFFYRSLSDLRSAHALCIAGEMQNAIASSHSACEKALKCYLLHLGEDEKKVERLRHSILSIFKKVAELEPRLSWLDLTTGKLDRLAPDASIRYDRLPLGTDSALGAFYSSLFTCGVLASIIEMDARRGKRAGSFQPARFYINALGTQAYCKSASEKNVTLVMFQSVPGFGSQMADMILDDRQSLLWLEVVDEHEDASLRHQLIWQLQNRGEPADPDKVKVHLSHTEEGSWSGIEISRQISKEEFEARQRDD